MSVRYVTYLIRDTAGGDSWTLPIEVTSSIRPHVIKRHIKDNRALMLRDRRPLDHRDQDGVLVLLNYDNVVSIAEFPVPS